MHICRFCGSERAPGSRARCEGCGGGEWRWKDDPVPAPVPTAPVQAAQDPPDPEAAPAAVFAYREQTDVVDALGNFVAGCGWFIVMVMVALMVFGAVWGTLESNREARAERFKHGVETQEDIKDHPEEYARALKQRAEAQAAEAARMVREKAVAEQEAGAQAQEGEPGHREESDPVMPVKDDSSHDQDPECRRSP